MAARVCMFLLLLNVVSGQRNDGLLDHLNNGMNFAKDFLGSESIAQKVAEFVVRAFQNANSQPIRRKPIDGYEDDAENFAQENRPSSYVEEAPSPLAPLKNLVRLFGLQPNQISAVAVNALVFVAQMISTFLAGPKRSNRPYRFDDTTQWILNKNSRKLQDILATAKNQSLPDLLEDIVEEQSQGEEASCIKLLVCKITPFVTKMQSAVFGEGKMEDEKSNGADSMYRHLPTSSEIEDRSALCEQKHQDCHGRCTAFKYKWGWNESPLCDCNLEAQTAQHIVERCPRRCYQGNPEDLYLNVTPDAVNWLRNLDVDL